jgi:hypothetical protein
MKDLTRRRLEMARRVVAFNRAHPSTDPAYLALAARLERLVDRAEELERQERSEAEELRRTDPSDNPEPL